MAAASIKVGGKYISKGRKKTNSKNVYIDSLIKLYERIALRSDNPVIHKIAARLKMSRSNRPPIKISKLVNLYKKRPEVACVMVNKLLDDERVMDMPAITVVCLQASKEAKKKVESFGGRVCTLDQLFEVCPGLENMELYRGKVTARKVYKYFGAPGEKNSRAYPRTLSKGKNREKRLLKKNENRMKMKK